METQPVPVHTLTTAQRRVLEWVERYESALDEPCPAGFVARRMGLHHSTIQQHITALHRKGWLRTNLSPVSMTQRIPR